MMFGLMSVLVHDHDLTETVELAEIGSTTTKETVPRYFRHGSLVPYHRNLKNDKTFLGTKYVTASAGTTGTAVLAQGPTLYNKFPGTLSYLNEVKEHVPAWPNSDPEKGFNTSQLMDFFVAGKSLEWMNRAFEALEYEAKFFDGSSTLESIGFEAGPEVLTKTTVKFSAPSFDAKAWFPTFVVDGKGLTVDAKREAITESHLQLGLFQQSIVHYTGLTTTYLHSVNTASSTITGNDLPVYTEGYTRRRILNTEDTSHGLYTLISSSMALKIADVL